MDMALYPGIRHSANLLEVVDASNTRFCLMQEEDVIRQGLTCRAVAVRLRDRDGRALLRHTGSLWDFSSRALLPAGQGYEELARRLLWQDWQQEGRSLHELGLCTPNPGEPQKNNLQNDGSCSFTAIYEARIPAALLRQLASDPSRCLLLDHDELKGLTTQMEEMFSPLLLHALSQRLLQPH